MPDYAIGDVQGCFDALLRLLEAIDFDEKTDQLWFVGDLVNRGPQSLAVLRFIYSLPKAAHITLGNHDLHLLACLFAEKKTKNVDDSLDEILKASDGVELGHWLRNQPFLYYSKELEVVMCHAGIAPMWDLPMALRLANELQTVLSGEQYKDFLNHMYGNEPNRWSPELSGYARLRTISNYFTRMRYCDAKAALQLEYKGPHVPPSFYPWYEVPGRKAIKADIVFGHWASLLGKSPHPSIHPIDSGCFWGGDLTALRLQDKKRISVSCAL